jgi:hypothetical protein
MWACLSPRRNVRNASLAVARRRARPSLESLESREVLSAAPLVAPVLGPALFAPLAQQHQAAMVPISVTQVAVQNGGLVASGLIGAQPFSNIPVTLTVPQASSTAASQAATTTPILTLHLAPIDLNLLGLEVKTSEICLNVTAIGGPGNLLGNLLGNVAHLLDGGTSLGGILSGLSATQLNTLTMGVQGLVNGALSAVTAQAATSSATDILHLSLGPIHLNLLGLDVTLNNCASPAGPITVDLIANSGPGNLLGNLLTSVSHSFDNLGLPTTLAQRLDHIAELLVADAALLGA